MKPLLLSMVVSALLVTLSIPLLAQNRAAGGGRGGYLPADQMPDTGRIALAAPVAGDARDTADRAIFRATRSFEGTPRWVMARSDDDTSTPSMLKAFSCAIGVSLDPQTAPRLTALMMRMSADNLSAATRVKNLYPQRKRPFLVESGPVCLANTTNLANNSDYPSAHTVYGWSWGLVLAELVPGRATDIMIRARAFGESRVVCGLHNASAIEAGRMIAGSVAAALHGNAAFRSDLEAARTEIAGLRAAEPLEKSPMCTAESEMLAKPLY
jgi:acid phosphatase (class A)